MIRAALVILSLLACSASWAQLTIEITKGRDNPTSIAIVPFGWQGVGVAREDVAAIIEADLKRTGQFAPVSRDDMLGSPQQASEVYYRDWRALNVDYLVVGKILPTAEGLVAEYEMFDVYTQRKVLSNRVNGDVNSLRNIAHKVSDGVYEKLTGIRGAFSTRLLYISAIERGNGEFTYRLLVSDVDGANESVVFESDDPLVTPTWAPDGERIAYVSFETTRAAIFMHNLKTGERTQLTNYKGLNGAPSWSPDGKQLAMVLSKDGSPDIYVMDIATRTLKRVTRHFAIDTEPAWMPDGKSIIYTSDRGGKPQIYQVTLANGYEERVTFEGDYNARARVVPDGSGIIMVHRNNGNYHIAMLDIERGSINILTETSLDESPSISPNGAMLLYATKYQGKGILAAVSLDGGVKFRLPSRFGEVREPAWSPYMK
ncbi:MAG: Tol-Pal system protein TolB [Oceanicoccus sp.]|uniref:Tol-Pal system beta propeller repeat protein TolB n=1 Tax=Oceanicoccus sp. TaxID=2691044 RepID=UPI00261E2C23|nr:Tol-Pal system beta propeller repeat protein TolB [Oceanicoccus sp.]MCP3909247.1 Tol-Pal system protein TolB [Oceanicoccus sp.]MDG1771823.1 Tol-Pal system beta propeller repeat protein TolB [Oceanicoccus sp.]